MIDKFLYWYKLICSAVVYAFNYLFYIIKLIFYKNNKTELGINKAKNSTTEFALSNIKEIKQTDEIPKYPPWKAGLPVVLLETLIGTQLSLIQAIKNEIGMKSYDFDEIVLPVIYSYAKYVHLLPASQNDHHRGAGGLFRHGLEVAFWAVQASKTIVLTKEENSEERYHNKLKWLTACAIAGLTHDIGKPITDVIITIEQHDDHWHPWSLSLTDWLQQHQATRYFVNWQKQRYKEHEKFNVSFTARIIPQKTYDFLASRNDVIFRLMETVSSVNTQTNPIAKAVITADVHSTKLDKDNQTKGEYLNTGYMAGVNIFELITDSLRAFCENKIWRVNELKDKIWHFNNSTFIVWDKHSANQIINHILEKGFTTIEQRTLRGVTDVLIENEFIIPFEKTEKQANGSEIVTSSPYWTIVIEPTEFKQQFIEKNLTITEQRLTAIRLANPIGIFPHGFKPKTIKATIVDDPEQEIIFKEIADYQAPQDQIQAELLKTCSKQQIDSQTGEIIYQEKNNFAVTELGISAAIEQRPIKDFIHYLDGKTMLVKEMLTKAFFSKKRLYQITEDSRVLLLYADDKEIFGLAKKALLALIDAQVLQQDPFGSYVTYEFGNKGVLLEPVLADLVKKALIANKTLATNKNLPQQQELFDGSDLAINIQQIKNVLDDLADGNYIDQLITKQDIDFLRRGVISTPTSKFLAHQLNCDVKDIVKNKTAISNLLKNEFLR